MIRTSSLNVTVGSQPSFSRALVASPQQRVDLGRAEVARVDLDDVLPVDAEVRAGLVEELAHRVHLAGGDHVVVGLVLLEHPPHRLDVVGRVAPVALGVEVAEEELVLQAEPGCAASARVILRVTNVSPRRGGLVVEEDPVATRTSRRPRGS